MDGELDASCLPPSISSVKASSATYLPPCCKIRLLQLADKYDAPLVAEMAVHLLTPYIESNSPFVFGAAVYHQLGLAQAALSKFGSAIVEGAVTHYINRHNGNYASVGYCPYRTSSPNHLLSSVPDEFPKKFPSSLLIRLMKMQEEVAFSNATWSVLALQLQVSSLL